MAYSEYIPTQWVDGSAPAINAANLNHLEQGIKDATDNTIELDNRVQDLETADLPWAEREVGGVVRVTRYKDSEGRWLGKIWTTPYTP